MDNNTANIYGSELTVTGTNLRQISNIYAKVEGAGISTATWETISITFLFEIRNTTCSGDRSASSIFAPSGMVHPMDITQTSVTITNMNYRGCYNGDLYA